MAPLREGEEIALLNITDGATELSWRGKHWVTSDRDRPIIVENDAGGDASSYRAAITPPMAAPSINFSTGLYTGRIAVAVARYDSVRGRLSNPGTGSPGGSRTVAYNPNTGADANLRDTTGHERLAMGFRVPRAQSAGVGLVGANGGFRSVTLRLKRSAAALTGNLTVQFFASTGSGPYTPGSPMGAASTVVAASTLTTSYADITFQFSQSFSFGDGVYFMVLDWTGAIDATNFVQLEHGAGTTATGASTPAPDTNLTSQTVSVPVTSAANFSAGSTCEVVDASTFVTKLFGTLTSAAGPLVVETDLYPTVTANTDVVRAQGPALAYNGASWAAYPSSSSTWHFSMTSAGVSRGAFTSFYELNAQAFTITNLASFVGDEATDDYDQFAILVFSAELGEIKLVDTVDATATTYGFNLSAEDIVGKPNVLPDFLRVPPACNVARTTLAPDGQRRVVMANMTGFDAFIDQPRLYYFTPEATVNEDGIITADDAIDFTSLNGTDFTNGQYLATIFDATDGREIARGFVGAGDEDWELTLYSDLARTVPLTGTNDPTLIAALQRCDLRRQVIAHVTQNSDRVRLTYDTAGATAATSVGEQWMAWQNLVVGALGGGYVYKVASVSGSTVLDSLTSPATAGAGLILESGWGGDSGSDLFVLVPLARTIWLTNGDSAQGEATGPKQSVTLDTPNQIVTFGQVGDNMMFVTAKRDAYIINGFEYVVDPTTYRDAVGYNLQQQINTRSMAAEFSCVSPWSWVTTPDAMGIWVGSEGPYLTDGRSVTLLVENSERERWNGYAAQYNNNIRAVVDAAHAYSPYVRFARIKTSVTDKRTEQLALVLGSGAFVNYSPQHTTDCMAQAVGYDGSLRVIFGGSGRMWSYGRPARPGQNTSGDLYGFPRLPAGTTYGTDMTWDEGTNTFTSPASTFTDLGAGTYFYEAGILMAVIDPDGDFIFAEIASRTSDTQLVAFPQTADWLDEELTYSFVIGPRHLIMRLPTLRPDADLWGLSLDWFQMPSEHGSAFEFPVKITITSSNQGATLDTTEDTRTFFSDELETLQYQQIWAQGPYYSCSVRVEMIGPPDAILDINDMRLGCTQHE